MFLNAFMLAGLFAVASPVVIHLLRRTPPRPLKWAATRFLKKAHAANKNRMRVQDLLLLILRCLIVALLALAMARPVLGGWIGSLFAATGVGSRRAIILLDTSLSMQQVDGASPLIDQAKQAARSIVSGLPVGSTAAVWRFDSRVDPVIAEPIGTMSAVTNAIDTTSATDRGTDLTSALDRAMSTGTPARPVDVFVITDMQRRAFLGSTEGGSMESFSQRISAAQGSARVTFVPVGSIERAIRPNLAVSSVELVDGIATTSRPLRIRVGVSNFDQAEVRDVKVRITLRKLSAGDDAGSTKTAMTLDQRVIGSIAAGQTGSAWLLVKINEPGEHLLTASIDGDSLQADDSASLLVNVSSRFRIGLVSNASTQSPPPPEASSFFLRQALAAMNPRTVNASDDSSRAVAVTPLSSSELGLGDLSAFDAVFVMDRQELAAGLSQQLLAYVDQGGTLVFVPPPTLTARGIEPALRAGLLPASVGGLRQNLTAELDAAALDHPLVSIWKNSDSGGINAVRIASRFDLTPAAGARVVLRTSDGNPFMVEQTIGRGLVVMFAGGLDRASSNLPVRPGVFVPLIARVIAYGQSTKAQGLNARLGDWATLNLGEVDQTSAIQLTGPDGAAGPTSFDAPVRVIGGRFVAQSDEARQAGVYRWQRGGRSSAVVNLVRDPEESDTTILGSSDRSLLTRSGAAELSGSRASDRQRGFEFAGLLLVVLVLLGATEMYLAKRFTPSGGATK